MRWLMVNFELAFFFEVDVDESSGFFDEVLVDVAEGVFVGDVALGLSSAEGEDIVERVFTACSLHFCFDGGLELHFVV